MDCPYHVGSRRCVTPTDPDGRHPGQRHDWGDHDRDAYRAARAEWLAACQGGASHALVRGRWDAVVQTARRIGVVPGVKV